mgnify:CR=1 FL=1
MATATYQVSVAWEAVPSESFMLDGSALDSTDQLTNAYSDSLDVLTFGISTFAAPPDAILPAVAGTDVFSSTFDAVYSDVSAVVQGISIKRGRDDNLSTFGAGEATVVLYDPDGSYNPLNTSSPLSPNVVPGRPIRIQGTFGGTAYGVYKGFVRSIEYDPAPDARTTTVHAQDLMLYLSRAKPVVTNTGTITTGAAIGTVLTAIDWTEAQYRTLGTGDTINAGFSSNAADTGLALIEGFLETERGEFFMSRGGTAVYRDRYDRYSRASAGTLTNVASGGVAATDLTNIRNRASVTKTGSGTATATDYVSVSRYGLADGVAIDSAYINDAAHGTGLAQWIVSQTASPTPPVRELRYTANVSDALMVHALSRDLGDRITIVDTALDTSADMFIEGIEHRIRVGKIHEVSYTMTRVPASSPITFGTSRVYSVGRFGSPTDSISPWDTADTTDDIFVF